MFIALDQVTKLRVITWPPPHGTHSGEIQPSRELPVIPGGMKKMLDLKRTKCKGTLWKEYFLLGRSWRTGHGEES